LFIFQQPNTQTKSTDYFIYHISLNNTRNMGKFVIFVHASPESETGKMPTTEEFAEMGAFNAELRKAGALITADGLLQSAKGARVHFSDSDPRVENGPFQVENLVAGFWILKLDSFDEAVAWAKKIPFKKGSVEVRKIAGPEDFGPELTAQLKNRESELRAEVEKEHSQQ
jgi:hypothetical protein